MTINRNKSNTGDGTGRSCSQNEGTEKDRSFVALIFYFFARMVVDDFIPSLNQQQQQHI